MCFSHLTGAKMEHCLQSNKPTLERLLCKPHTNFIGLFCRPANKYFEASSI